MPAIRVARKLKAIDVIDVLSDLFILRGIPATSGLTMGRIRGQGRAGVDHSGRRKDGLYRARQSVGKRNVESFNARLRDELLDGEIFYTLREAQIVIESWRRHFNTIRPHESLGYKPPAPEVFVQAFAAWPAAPPAPPATLPLAQRPTLN